MSKEYEKVIEVVEDFKKLDVASLERKGQDFNFTPIQPLVSESINQILELRNYPNALANCPTFVGGDGKFYYEVNNHLLQFLDCIKLMRDFNPKIQDPQVEVDMIIDRVLEKHKQLSDSNFFLNLKTAKFEKDISLTPLEQSQQGLMEIKRLQQQAEKSVDAIQKASVTKGTDKFAGIYTNKAKQHQISMCFWIAAFVLVVVGFSRYILTMESPTTKELWSIDVLIFFSKRAFLVSIFSVMIYQIIKRYNINNHLYTVAKNKEDALRIMPTFIESTSDQETKNAILHKMVISIFDDLGNTGYNLPSKGNN